MKREDGLGDWEDGPIQTAPADAPAPRLISAADVARQHLWVVGVEDVVHAQERSDFGKKLKDGVIKHTNLTSGSPAFSGGELIFLDESTIAVNGCSGRYGPLSAQEMLDVAMAFAESGYGVWAMGFDADANRPLPFIGVEPTWLPAK